MNYGPFLAAVLLAAAPTPNAPDLARTPATTVRSAGAGPVPAAPLARAPLAVGDVAPDFVYQSHDFLWQKLHNILEQGSVLLVFGATDEQLRTLERDQDDLLGRGVIPVAVVGQHESDVWHTVRRDGITYSLLADPHAAIAEQFGALDRSTQKPRTVWFAIDRTGHVRGTGEGPSPARTWTALATAALGLGDTHNAGSR